MVGPTGFEFVQPADFGRFAENQKEEKPAL